MKGRRESHRVSTRDSQRESLAALTELYTSLVAHGSLDVTDHGAAVDALPQGSVVVAEVGDQALFWGTLPGGG